MMVPVWSRPRATGSERCTCVNGESVAAARQRTSRRGRPEEESSCPFGGPNYRRSPPQPLSWVPHLAPPSHLSRGVHQLPPLSTHLVWSAEQVFPSGQVPHCFRGAKEEPPQCRSERWGGVGLFGALARPVTSSRQRPGALGPLPKPPPTHSPRRGCRSRQALHHKPSPRGTPAACTQGWVARTTGRLKHKPPLRGMHRIRCRPRTHWAGQMSEGAGWGGKILDLQKSVSCSGREAATGCLMHVLRVHGI
jgi:hypothetical protein